LTIFILLGIISLVIYMEYNICKFLPNRRVKDSLNIINLVYETECGAETDLKTIATYRMHYITEGRGILHTKNGDKEIKKGDTFILPPAFFHNIENRDSIKYIYISFLGTRANILSEQFKLSDSVNIYESFSHLEPLWLSLFDSNDSLTDMCCEGILLYTYSEIGKRIFTQEEKKTISSVGEKIKIIIDEDFCSHNLSVESISQKLSYHPKYVSSVFKKEFGIGINDYIKTLRLQQSLTLMEQGVTSIKDISALCGYSDSLYFSTVFKKDMKISPKEHIKNIHSK